jgi:sulfur-oxidizing protein SoxZ
MNKPRVRMPDTVKVGDIIEIKSLIGHVMETGQRRGEDGKIVPRNIINAFTATFNGRTVFSAELQPGISANPYIGFFMKVSEPGEFEFTWLDDSGDKLVERTRLAVS